MLGSYIASVGAAQPPGRPSNGTAMKNRNPLGNDPYRYKALGGLLETGKFADIDIYAGRDEKEKHYRLHRAVIGHNSGYFERVLDGTFLEAERNEIRLTEHDPELFDFVVYWLYYGEIRNRPTTPSDSSHFWKLDEYAALIAYGSYFDIPSMKKEVVFVIEQLLTRLGPNWWEKNGRQNELNQALKVIFEGYHTDREVLDNLISAIAKRDYLRTALVNEELRAVLMGNNELAMKLLDIKCGVGQQAVTQESRPSDKSLMWRGFGAMAYEH